MRTVRVIARWSERRGVRRLAVLQTWRGSSLPARSTRHLHVSSRARNGGRAPLELGRARELTGAEIFLAHSYLARTATAVGRSESRAESDGPQKASYRDRRRRQ